MNVFREIGNLVKKNAPLIGGLVSGGNPLAVGLLSALTGNKDAKAPDILKYLQNNPEAISKLQEIELANQHELSLEELKMDRDIIQGSYKVQEANAKSLDPFVARARPALMWVCTAIFLYAFIIHPFLMLCTGKAVAILALPAEFYAIIPTLFGIYATARSIDKFTETKKGQ